MDIVNKMTLDGPSGNGADVFMAPHDAYLTAKDSGILLELDEKEKMKSGMWSVILQ